MFWYNDNNNCDYFKARVITEGTVFCGGNYRKRVKIWECWGNVVDRTTGMIIHENVVWTVADDRFLIRKPTPNPFWHGESPFIKCPFIRVPNSVWHRALMDAPTQGNLALNELYNLMVDDGMNSAHGIKQIRPDWLEDDSQITNGIYPGITLKANAQCPPGGKVLEVIQTGGLQPETFNVYQAMNSEFSASALTNDLRMGVMPNRAVKATEVVEASQSITGVFTGLVKILEENYVVPNLSMMFKNMLQHMNDLNSKEVEDLITKDRAQKIAALSPAQLFAGCVEGYKFKVFGISRILAKQKDFKKLTALLQTVFGSEPLAEEFMKEYSPGKLITEIIRSLDISIDRIKLDEQDKAAMQAAAAQDQANKGGGASDGQNPDSQSQIPQANAQGGAETVESMVPRANFGGLEGKAKGGMN